jgi:hypothetical protein
MPHSASLCRAWYLAIAMLALVAILLAPAAKLVADDESITAGVRPFVPIIRECGHIHTFGVRQYPGVPWLPLGFMGGAWCAFLALLPDDLSIPWRDAVAVLQEREARVRSVRYTVRYVELRNKTAARERNDDELVDGTYEQVTVLYDVPSGRYRLDLEAVLRWEGGLDPYISQRNTFAFDGVRHSHVEQSVHGPKLPPTDAPRRGTIGNAPVQSGLPALLATAFGLEYVPPYAGHLVGDSVQLRLSEMIERTVNSGQPLKIVAGSDGIWDISGFTATNGLGPYRMRYDPSAGMLREVAFEHQGKVWERYEVDVVALPDGFTVPREVRLMGLIGESGDGRRWTFSDFEINPTVTDEDFRVQFPPGTKVVDTVSRKSFIAGADPASEASAVAAYMASHNLRQPDEPQGRGPWFWALSGGGLLAAALAGFWFWRRGHAG